MNTLQLIIPAQSDIADPRIERVPARLREWIDSLPYASPEVTLRKLNESIYGCNRQTITPNVRIELLEHYHHAATLLLEGLIDPAATQRLSERQRKLNELRRNLIKEMGLGYKTVLMDAEAQRDHRKVYELFNTALFATMHYTSVSMFQAYQTYEPPPPNAWRELNHLYRFALRHDLTKKSGGTAMQPLHYNSIEQVYLRAI